MQMNVIGAVRILFLSTRCNSEAAVKLASFSRHFGSIKSRRRWVGLIQSYYKVGHVPTRTNAHTAAVLVCVGL